MRTRLPRYFFFSATGTNGTFPKWYRNTITEVLFLKKNSVFSVFCYHSSNGNRTISLSLEWS